MSIQIGSGNTPSSTLNARNAERLILKSAYESNIVRISSDTNRATFNCDQYNFGRYNDLFQLSMSNTPIFYAQPQSFTNFSPTYNSNTATFHSNVTIQKTTNIVDMNANSISITGMSTSNILSISRSNAAPILNIPSSGTISVSTPVVLTNTLTTNSDITVNNASKVYTDEMRVLRVVERTTDTTNAMAIEFNRSLNDRVLRFNATRAEFTGAVTFNQAPIFLAPVEYTDLKVNKSFTTTNTQVFFNQTATINPDSGFSNMIRFVYSGDIDTVVSCNVTNLINFRIRPADSNLTALCMDNRGHFGIGTSTPNAIVDIVSTPTNSASFYIRAVNSNAAGAFSNCRDFAISSNAFVGIGTSLPQYKLHVRGCDDDPIMVGASNDTEVFRISSRGQVAIGTSQINSSLALDVTSTMQTRIPNIEIHDLTGNPINSNIINGHKAQILDLGMISSSNSVLSNIYTRNIYADYIFTNSYENLGMDCIEGSEHLFQVKVQRFQHMGTTALFSANCNLFQTDPISQGKLKIMCDQSPTTTALSRGIAIEGPKNTSMMITSSNNGAFYEMASCSLTSSLVTTGRIGIVESGAIAIGHDQSPVTNPTSDFTASTQPKILIHPSKNDVISNTPVIELLSTAKVTKFGVYVNQATFDSAKALQVTGDCTFKPSGNPTAPSTLCTLVTNVGIRTDNPLSALDVNGPAFFRDTLRLACNVTIGSSVTNTTDALLVTNSNIRNAQNIININNNLGTGNSLRITTPRSNVTIDNNGYVGVGTTPLFELDINGNFNFTGTIYKNGSKYIESQWTTVSPTNPDVYILNNVGIGTLIPTAGVHVVGKSIYCSSNITADGTMYSKGSFITTSDRAVKTDLVQISDALDKLDKLTGYTYHRTDTNKRETGLIAQDVQQVLPEVVNRDDSNGLLSIAYGNMAGLFVEAIKDLRTRVASLEARISSCNSL